MRLAQIAHTRTADAQVAAVAVGKSAAAAL